MIVMSSLDVKRIKKCDYWLGVYIFKKLLFKVCLNNLCHTFCRTQLLLEKDQIMEIPANQRMERQETLAREHSKEHKAALQRAVTLAVPHAYSPSQYGTFEEQDEGGDSHGSSGESSFSSSKKSRTKENWDELIERLFEKDESGHMVLKKSHRDD